MKEIITTNPTTGKTLKAYPYMSSQEVDTILEQAHAAFHRWKKTSFEVRATKMRRLATLIRKHANEAARLFALEMGKPVSLGLSEIEKCAQLCEYFADTAAKHLAPRTIKTSHRKSYVCYEPLGTLFCIAPWNFPFWQVLRCTVSNLMAGNAIVFAHAPIVTGTGLLIERLVHSAGFPKTLVRALIIDIPEAARVIAHPLTMGLNFTGSEKAGRDVGQKAGAALKKAILELGGSDPYVILADADLENAVTACLAARLSNSGQVCIAAKRIIVVDKIRARFEKLLLEKIKAYTLGDPLDPATCLGPMARQDLREKLHAQVQQSIKEGARLILGGLLPTGAGYFYPPTVLFDVMPGMTAFEEELFGPVVCIVPAKNEKDAMTLANQTRYGLGSAIFTKNTAKAEKLAHEIEAGTVSINQALASSPKLPFGGVKASGYGRENSEEGIREFVNIKTIMIK